MVDTDDGLKAAWKPGYKACPYLSFEGTKACCAVHDRPEYEGGPCWTYGNSEADPDFAHKKGKPCRVGEMFQSQGGYLKHHPQAAEPLSVGDLEVFAPWQSSYPQRG